MFNGPSSQPKSIPAADGNPGNRFFSALKQWLVRNRLLSAVYPSTVIKIRLHDEIPWPVKSLQTNDRIYIPAGEVVPCDSILATDSAIIDYSLFTSGYRVERKRGELIYAGGKIVGGRVILKVHETMTPNRFGYLLNLLKRQHRKTTPARNRSLQLLLLSTLTGLFRRMRPAAKTAKQNNGRVSGRTARYEGLPLSEHDMQLVLFATTGLDETYAQAIRHEMQRHVQPGRFAGEVAVTPGEGIAIGHLLQLGNAAFAGTQSADSSETEIWLRIDSQLMGKFVLSGL